ncbi:MAG: class II aldolase/adducin family protein [Bacteroidales bacterium]
MKENEGYIKFKYEWEKKPFTFPRKSFQRINFWRQKLYNMGLIGMCDGGIGFGNISIRIDNTNEFIITGSATGRYRTLNSMHYAWVDYFEIENNFLQCIGETKASSESLTHAAVYMENPSVNAVIHTHNKDMWNKFLNNKPTTSPEAEFGTPDLAKEIRKLMKSEEVEKEKIVVMGGHEEGILTFGTDVDEAGEAMLEYYNKIYGY